MIQKILVFLFILLASVSFSQEKLIRNSIENVSAAPNPFTNYTKISFQTKSASEATLTVKNVLGKTVFKKKYSVTKGKNSILFYKRNLLAGIYIYSISNQKNNISKRFVIQ